MVAHCDNQAVVEVVNAGYCKDPELMQLLRTLFFLKAQLEITIKAVHIPGRQNGIADAISRNNMSAFFLQAPRVRKLLCEVPVALIELLVIRKPDWTSPSWSQLLTDCLQQA